MVLSIEQKKTCTIHEKTQYSKYRKGSHDRFPMYILHQLIPNLSIVVFTKLTIESVLHFFITYCTRKGDQLWHCS